MITIVQAANCIAEFWPSVVVDVSAVLELPGVFTEERPPTRGIILLCHIIIIIIIIIIIRT